MSGIQVETSFDGFGRVSARLQRLTPINRTLVLDRLGQVVEMQVRKRFQTKTAPDGRAWIVRWGARNATYDFGKHEWGYKDFSHPLMVLSGHLRDSIHHVVVSTDSVRIGSNLIYAAIHQRGGEILPKNGSVLVFSGASGDAVATTKVVMPARPYLGFSADNKKQIERILITLIGAQLNG